MGWFSLKLWEVLEEVHSYLFPAIKFIGKIKAVGLKIKVPIKLKNYPFFEYVKFGTISWKFDISSITA